MFRLGACVLLIALAFVAQITADDEEARLNARCRSDPNAIIGCQPDYCGQVCFNFAATELACTGRCERKGCRCVDGFKFDPNALKCVPEAECTRPVAVPLGDGAALN